MKMSQMELSKELVILPRVEIVEVQGSMVVLRKAS